MKDIYISPEAKTPQAVEAADDCGFNCNWGFGIGIIIVVAPVPGPT